jgi:hypothetical protein
MILFCITSATMPANKHWIVIVITHSLSCPVIEHPGLLSVGHTGINHAWISLPPWGLFLKGLFQKISLWQYTVSSLSEVWQGARRCLVMLCYILLRRCRFDGLCVNDLSYVIGLLLGRWGWVGARACIRPYMRAWLRPSVRLSRHVCVGRYLAPYVTLFIATRHATSWDVTLFIATRHVTRRHAIYRHTSRHKASRYLSPHVTSQECSTTKMQGLGTPKFISTARSARSIQFENFQIIL